MTNDDSRSRERAWSGYWGTGALHSLAGSFQGNYTGPIRAFWEQAFKPLEPGDRVLDVGTGNGALPALLVELQPASGAEIDAIDLAVIVPAWLADTPAQVQQRVRFHGGVSAEDLPFPDGHFDLVVSQYGIEYTDHAGSIAEVARSLRPGGRCAFVLHHAGAHLHAVARDEVAAARLLLGEEGLLQRAAPLLPFLARAATGQVEQLRADPEANRVRAAYNLAVQAVEQAAGSIQHPQLLLDARQWVSGMANAVAQGQADAATAGARLADYRRDIELAQVRSRELCSHALDAAGLARFSGLLEAAGMRDVATAPLHHQQYLVGWTLRATRA